MILIVLIFIVSVQYTQSDLVNPTSLVEEDMWITSPWSRKRDGLIEFDELMNFQGGEECFDSVIVI